MKRYVIMSIFIGFTIFLLSSVAIGSSQEYKVIRAVDGDTVVVAHNGKEEKIRLLCIDTPESVHPDKKQNIPMGKVASDFTAKRLTGKYEDLELGPEFRDRYGRLLAYVVVGGENFNIEIVRQGLSPNTVHFGAVREQIPPYPLFSKGGMGGFGREKRSVSSLSEQCWVKPLLHEVRLEPKI